VMNEDITYIKSIISSVKPLPPKKQKFGSTTVTWWEGKPGDAIIMAKAGSVEDRILAETTVANDLAAFGYKRATFHFAAPPELATEILDRERRQTDDGFNEEDDNLNAQQRDRVIQRQDNWNDLVEKAKRIVNTGGVTLVRNSPEFVVGSVRGDHGNYNSEITRQDPESQAITGWHCTCPWNQYAWQRTRQWKVYEGRPCSHVLALYYVSKLSPVEGMEGMPTPAEAEAPPALAPQAPGEASPFATPPGAPQEPGTPGGAVPSVPRGPRGIEQLTPFKPEDVGATSPDEILEQRLGPLAPQRPEAPPEEEQENLLGMPGERPAREPRPRIQRPPLEILKEQQREREGFMGPGEAPYGGPAPRGTVSVPGARVPTERNPIQFPGGTYSKSILTASEAFSDKIGQSLKIKSSVIAMAFNDTYTEIPAGSTAKIRNYDPVTGMVEAEFDNARCYLSGAEIEA